VDLAVSEKIQKAFDSIERLPSAQTIVGDHLTSDVRYEDELLGM